MKTMAKIRHLFLLLLVLASALPAAAIPPKPSPQRLVNDFAGLFTAGQVDELERKLVAFDDSTSNQITVVTVNDLEGRAAADYADRIGIEWGVGSKARNNGIVVLVKPKTPDSGGQVTIQVGYGLEGAIPDIYASRIIRNDMIPHFQVNDYYGGVEQACETLMALASGEIAEPRSRDDEEDDVFESLLAMLILLFLMILVIKMIHRSGGNHGGGNGTGGVPGAAVRVEAPGAEALEEVSAEDSAVLAAAPLVEAAHRVVGKLPQIRYDIRCRQRL